MLKYHQINTVSCVNGTFYKEEVVFDLCNKIHGDFFWPVRMYIKVAYDKK